MGKDGKTDFKISLPSGSFLHGMLCLLSLGCPSLRPLGLHAHILLKPFMSCAFCYVPPLSLTASVPTARETVSGFPVSTHIHPNEAKIHI